VVIKNEKVGDFKASIEKDINLQYNISLETYPFESSRDTMNFLKEQIDISSRLNKILSLST
jgi:hypothetical protein